MTILKISLLLIPIFLKSLYGFDEKNARPAMIQTELRVAKSLNPEDTQTLDVMTKDGGVAQLIVKRRNNREEENRNRYKKRSYRPSYVSAQSLYVPQNIVRLNSFPIIQNLTEGIWNLENHAAYSKRNYPVPKPVTIFSDNVYVKPSHSSQSNTDIKNKRGRSLVEIDSDGIPVIHGVRVADDESDKKVWRNARVINGELVPYENGYKPPPVISAAQLVYAKRGIDDENVRNEGIGPFNTKDNYRSTANYNQKEAQLLKVIDNINQEESRKDYRNHRHFDGSSKIQKRMLDYPESAPYHNPNYPPKVTGANVYKGVRAPILEYAHPELGIQFVKPETDYAPYYDNSISKTHLYTGRQTHSNYINNPDNYKTNLVYKTYKSHKEQPFWIRLTETIKDNMQTGLNTVEKFTRPVFEPIVQATQKITSSLGLSRRSTTSDIQKRIDVGNSAIIPALGLVAGGAALGLGAAAVKKLLEQEQMRSGGSVNYPEDVILIMKELEAIDDGKNAGRSKRSLQLLKEDLLQKIDTDFQSNDLEHLRASHFWSDTACSKKLFCEVLVTQNAEKKSAMENKINSLIKKISSTADSNVAIHLQEVLSAMNSKNCSIFSCSKMWY